MRVIVTGASKGIGRGIASYLAMDGHQVGLVARSKGLLEDLRQSLEEQGGACYSVACDLTDYDQTEYAISACVEGLGGVDALVNNAGLVTRKSFVDISLDEWRAMVDINVHGTFHAIRAVLPFMRRQQRGHVINISSISGKLPLPGGSGYAATKFALTGLSLSLFQELRDEGICVSTVYPGSVDSASHRHGPDADHSWKVTPEEVGQACRDILRLGPETAISELEIRPLYRPKQ